MADVSEIVRLYNDAAAWVNRSLTRREQYRRIMVCVGAFGTYWMLAFPNNTDQLPDDLVESPGIIRLRKRLAWDVERRRLWLVKMREAVKKMKWQPPATA